MCWIRVLWSRKQPKSLVYLPLFLLPRPLFFLWEKESTDSDRYPQEWLHNQMLKFIIDLSSLFLLMGRPGIILFEDNYVYTKNPNLSFIVGQLRKMPRAKTALTVQLLSKDFFQHTHIKSLYPPILLQSLMTVHTMRQISKLWVIWIYNNNKNSTEFIHLVGYFNLALERMNQNHFILKNFITFSSLF